MILHVIFAGKFKRGRNQSKNGKISPLRTFQEKLIWHKTWITETLTFLQCTKHTNTTLLIAAHYTPSRMITDTTVKSAKQVCWKFTSERKNSHSSFIYIIHHSLKAQERNLSTGLKRLSGKGERIIILGCGGRKGWVYYEVYKRTKKVVNSMEYKNDVSK